MNKKKAILAGNISVDISPVFTSGTSSSFADIIHPGKITHIEGNEIHPGGSTANTGLAMSIFGIEPVISACIGDDDFGEMLRAMISSKAGEGAADGLVKVKESYTAYSIIMSVPGLDRAILQNPGANDEYTGNEISAEIMSSCSLLHFGHPSSMRRIYSNNGERLSRLMKRGNSCGLVTSLDLCSIDPFSEAAEQDWQTVLAKVLPDVDFFVPSAEELCSIIDPALYADWQRRAAVQNKDLTEVLSIDQEIMSLAEKAAELGAGNVLIKCGKQGMYLRTGDSRRISAVETKLDLPAGSMSAWIGKSQAEDAVKAEKEVSGLGAGDTSIAAFLSGMLRGMTPEECLYTAVREGARCVTAFDAISGLVPFERL